LTDYDVSRVVFLMVSTTFFGYRFSCSTITTIQDGASAKFFFFS